MRTCEPDPDLKSDCFCGCRQRATHRGKAEGMTLVMGCEMYVRRWVRNPLENAEIEKRRRWVARMEGRNMICEHVLPDRATVIEGDKK